MAELADSPVKPRRRSRKKAKSFSWTETREWLNVAVALGAFLVGIVSFWTTARISGLEDYLRSEIGRRNTELAELSQRTQRMQRLSDVQGDQLATFQMTGSKLTASLQEAQLKIQAKQDQMLLLSTEEMRTRGRIIDAEKALSELRLSNDSQSKLVDIFRRERAYQAVAFRMSDAFDIGEEETEMSGERSFQMLMANVREAAGARSDLAPYFREVIEGAPAMCRALRSYNASFDPLPPLPDMPPRPGERIDTDVGPAIQFKSRAEQRTYDRITWEWSQKFGEVNEVRSKGRELRRLASRYIAETARACLCKALEGPPHAQGKLCSPSLNPVPPELPDRRRS